MVMKVIGELLRQPRFDATLVLTLGMVSKNLSLWHNADNLINAVAAVNPNTIVIAHSVGPSIIEPWIENPNVTAVCGISA